MMSTSENGTPPTEASGERATYRKGVFHMAIASSALTGAAFILFIFVDNSPTFTEVTVFVLFCICLFIGVACYNPTQMGRLLPPNRGDN